MIEMLGVSTKWTVLNVIFKIIKI